MKSDFLGVTAFVGLAENLLLVGGAFIEVVAVLDAEFACLVASDGVVALGVAVHVVQEVVGFGGCKAAVEWF